MPRKHLMIFPGSGVDFLRAERSYDGVWLRSSQSTWLPHLLPAVYQSVELADFSFSSFRELPMGDPSLMPLPPNSAPYQVIVLAPVGEPYPTQWGAVLFHSQTHPPCLACERFVPDAGGIKRVVQSFFSEEFIGGMRFPERRHAELWVRHSLKIHDMLPDAYEAPRWLKEQQGLTPEEAAQKMAAMRLPTAASQYHNLRQQERARGRRAPPAGRSGLGRGGGAAWRGPRSAHSRTHSLAGPYAGSGSSTAHSPRASRGRAQKDREG